MNDLVWYALAGAAGGFISTIVRCDGCIVLPKIQEGRLYLNSLGGIVLGAASGMLGDANIQNAFMWGIGGGTIMPALVASVNHVSQNCKRTTENR